ncbi:hypothetical protein TNCV_29611 [Trichonephila clavipes]|nr:hypothetical protein TNCV_29611 [Trichonephila clavipes]
MRNDVIVIALLKDKSIPSNEVEKVIVSLPRQIPSIKKNILFELLIKHSEMEGKRRKFSGKRALLFLLPPLVYFSRPKYFLVTGVKQILFEASLPHTIGMPDMVLVCPYNRQVQDSPRLHWPGCKVVTSEASNRRW